MADKCSASYFELSNNGGNGSETSGHVGPLIRLVQGLSMFAFFLNIFNFVLRWDTCLF